MAFRLEFFVLNRSLTLALNCRQEESNVFSPKLAFRKSTTTKTMLRYKANVWCGLKTFAINFKVWSPLYFKGIFSSLQALQCILCLLSQQRQFYTLLLLPWGKSLLAPTFWEPRDQPQPGLFLEARERTLGTRLIWSLSACIVGPPFGANSRYLNAYNRPAFNYIKNQRVKTWLLRTCRAKIRDRSLFSKISKKKLHTLWQVR